MKLQEAIPPFSLIEDLIQGRRAATLVKTAKSCSLQVSPSLLLTIPTRMWAPSAFTIVSGPPLSPWDEHDTKLMTLPLMTHLAWSCSSPPRTHDQVFVDTLGLVHSLRTVAALDDGNYSLLQLVCGGLLDSSVSPAFDGKQENRVRHVVGADAAHHRRALPDQQGLNCCLEDRQG